MVHVPGAPIAIVLLVSMLACGSEEEASPVASSAPAPVMPTSTATVEAMPLEGTWRTAPVSPDDMEETLRTAGLGKWVGGFQRAEGDQPSETVFVLELRDGRWDLYREQDEGAAEPLDYDATYEVDGDTVVVSHEGDSNTYRWSVEGDTLTIEWIETTYPDLGDVPEEVFQRAFYQSGTFERQA